MHSFIPFDKDHFKTTLVAKKESFNNYPSLTIDDLLVQLQPQDKQSHDDEQQALPEQINTIEKNIGNNDAMAPLLSIPSETLPVAVQKLLNEQIDTYFETHHASEQEREPVRKMLLDTFTRSQQPNDKFVAYKYRVFLDELIRKNSMKLFGNTD